MYRVGEDVIVLESLIFCSYTRVLYKQRKA